MSNKTLKILLAVVVIFTIILFVVAINLNSSSKNKPGRSRVVEVKPENNTAEEINTKYKPTVSNYYYKNLGENERTNIDVNIDYVLNLINTKDYSRLYEILPLRYRQAKYTNVEEFKPDFDKVYTESNYSIVDYYIQNEITMYINTNYNFAIRLDHYKQDVTKINFFIEDYQSVSRINSLVQFDDVLIQPKFIIKYDTNMSIVSEITNFSDSDVTIDFTNTILADTNPIESAIANLISENNSITIPANKMVLSELKFTPLSRDIKKIYFKLKINGESVSDDKYITYYGDDEDE